MRTESKENTFSVVGRDGTAGLFVKGCTIREILEFFHPGNPGDVALAKIDDRLAGLYETLDRDARVEWIPLHSPEGQRAYQMTLSFILVRAAAALFPAERLVIDHSIGRGFFCVFRPGPRSIRLRIWRLRRRMEEIIHSDEPILPSAPPRDGSGAAEPAKVIDPDGPWVRCGAITDYFGSPLLDSTGRIRAWGLAPWRGGMILRFPDPEATALLPPFVPLRKLFRVFREFGEWERILGAETAADLNRVDASELVKVAEGLHEKKVVRIAEAAASGRSVVLIAGPSSSGKTTFAKRLSIQLRVNGLRPLMLSLDDYFLDRDRTPVGPDGAPDYESLEALDLERFRADLSALLEGREVRLRRYDFLTGRSVEGAAARVEKGNPVCIEGLHALNRRLAPWLPDRRKLRVYVSALTQVNLSDHLRVATSDVRFLRRMVRDAAFRDHSAEDSLASWPLVRRGEERYIFPFQEQSDAVFNSALTYEAGVLRVFAEPLLAAIPDAHPQKSEAERLLRLLRAFRPIRPDEVPPTSILREFIGGSSFRY